LKPFEYFRPVELDEAHTLLDRHGPDAMLLAGGTDLIVRLRAGRGPRVVVDLKRLGALSDRVEDAGAYLRIGARAVIADIANDSRVQKYFPALVESANVVGSIQIRNRATLAGNICNASPAADSVPALLVYGARLNLASSQTRRAVALADFFTGPGKTVARRGEILESIDLPIPRNATGAAFGRITRRRGVDLAMINLACAVDSSGTTRFAFGAVGPKPIFVEDPSGILADPHRDELTKREILAEMLSRTSPISNVRGSREYRSAMLEVISRRALSTALERLRAAQKN
jgi:CO/xanthine dehydrogenase FAD-binding subunit